MLTQEIQEAFVVPCFHVEQTRDDFVVAARFFQTATHNLAHIRTRDLAIHEERIHSRPERLVLLDHPLVEVIRDRTTTLALGPEEDRIVRANLGRQMLELDRRAGDGHDQTLDHVLELANIARPGVLGQRLHRLRRDAVDSRAARCGELREELVHKHRNVFSTITQRRNDYVNDVEAIEQILAERPLLDHFSQVTVGRSDHTHVDDAATAVGANFLQLACLEESEQEALHAQPGN